MMNARTTEQRGRRASFLGKFQLPKVPRDASPAEYRKIGNRGGLGALLGFLRATDGGTGAIDKLINWEDISR